jgi:anionic cell wall polymer biosynthesis LytR-Cps2A-Psr (LCP) family protein
MTKPITPAQETPTPNKQATPARISFWPLFFKAALLSLVFAGLMLMITALGVGAWGYYQLQKFYRVTELDRAMFTQQIKTGLKTEPVTTQKRKNILLLGVDLADGRGNSPALTDTIMLLSINFESGKINTLPLPRDLWSDDYQTKINALYIYGLDRYPDAPEQFTTEVIEKLTGVPIHHTVVLSLNQLQQLIDLVGGIEITVDQGFTDSLYPRAGVDVTIEQDPSVLYETITFTPGRQELSGERALQYIRSRHSEDEQGHDLARGARQQQVIEALLGKLTNIKALVTNPELVGELYLFYENNFAQALPLPELISTSKTLFPHRKTLSFTSHQLTALDDDPVGGVLDNPPRLAIYQNQWVYIIVDEKQFQTAVQEKLLLGHN